MKRFCSLLLTLALMLGLAACGQKPLTWQEQYDLGVKYLSEGNYEEAVIAFTAAIEIDPKKPDAFVGRGDAYVGTAQLSAGDALSEESKSACESAVADYLAAIELDTLLSAVYGKAADVYLALGDAAAAAAILERGAEATGDEGLQTRLEQLSAEEMAALAEALRPTVAALDIPFTVDGVTLGVTDISAAIAAYRDRPYALSHPMEDPDGNQADTVYTCYGMNDTPIPEGYERMNFGFLFTGPVGGGPVYYLVIQDSSFTCLGSLRTGDDAEAMLSLFGLEGVPGRLTGELVCETENGRTLRIEGKKDSEVSEEDFNLTYQADGKEAYIKVRGGKLHGVFLECL